MKLAALFLIGSSSSPSLVVGATLRRVLRLRDGGFLDQEGGGFDMGGDELNTNDIITEPPRLDMSWESMFNEPFAFLSNDPICGVWAEHNSDMYDRQFMFYTCPVGIGNQALSQAADIQEQVTYESTWGETFTFLCDKNKIMTGISSTTDTDQVDRRFQATCVKFEDLETDRDTCEGFSATNPSNGPFRNFYTRDLDYACPVGKVMTGFHSVFNENLNDRTFKIRCCGVVASSTMAKPGAGGLLILSPEWSDYENELDEDLVVRAELEGEKAAFFGFSSTDYSLMRNDRQFRFKYVRPSNSTMVETLTTTASSDYQEASLIACGGNSVLTKVESEHSNDEQDRRWSYECRTFSDMETSGCQWTDWVNSFAESFRDVSAGFDFECGAENVIAGISSFYDAPAKDRRFKFQCCRWAGPGMAVEPDPVAGEPDPVAGEPDPVAGEPDPVAGEPDPVIVEADLEGPPQ